MNQVQLKPYSVSKGRPYVNWWKELDELEEIVSKEPHFRTDKEKGKISELIELSSNWVTCACGNQCEIIPRGNGGFGCDAEPADTQLARLGLRFFNNILVRDVLEARETLQKIEERSAYLIKQELQKRDGSNEA